MQVVVYDPYEPRRQFMRDELGVGVCSNNAEVGDAADIIVIAVKPHFVHAALKEMGDRAKGSVCSLKARMQP
jgi:pyrroline-5-carboxylate reductase